ncbi:hypothetical protein CRENBAI_009618 [Crenichthys baileyi]|uniref:Uncharacterized protein n=1 Tax=Crenichthys baileyi TaxID=28760 RepID=A0AAV9RCQ8_9TELE
MCPWSNTPESMAKLPPQYAIKFSRNLLMTLLLDLGVLKQRQDSGPRGLDFDTCAIEGIPGSCFLVRCVPFLPPAGSMAAHTGPGSSSTADFFLLKRSGHCLMLQLTC